MLQNDSKISYDGSWDKTDVRDFINVQAPSLVLTYVDDSLFQESIHRHFLLFGDKVCTDH